MVKYVNLENRVFSENSNFEGGELTIKSNTYYENLTNYVRVVSMLKVPAYPTLKIKNNFRWKGIIYIYTYSEYPIIKIGSNVFFAGTISLSNDVTIGNHVTIGQDVNLNDCKIQNRAVIGNYAKIGFNAYIEPYTIIPDYFSVSSDNPMVLNNKTKFDFNGTHFKFINNYDNNIYTFRKSL
jgi:acetyltransferase-like isoleucine patch superfamily enzyme